MDTGKWVKTLDDYGNKLEKFASKLVINHNVAALKPRAKATDSTELVTLVVSAIVRRAPVVFNEPEDEDDVVPLEVFSNDRFDQLVKHQRSGNVKTPSAAANSSSFPQTQKQEFPIYDGRHTLDRGAISSTFAMPTSLYHPVFQLWRTWASDRTLTPPPQVVAASAKLMRRASVLHATEDIRKRALRGPLQDALRYGIDTVVNEDLTMPDGRTSIKVEFKGSVRNVPVIIDEEKCEAAEATADAATQASFSMLRAWSLPDVILRNIYLFFLILTIALSLMISEISPAALHSSLVLVGVISSSVEQSLPTSVINRDLSNVYRGSFVRKESSRVSRMDYKTVDSPSQASPNMRSGEDKLKDHN